jgi:hypothetical protein
MGLYNTFTGNCPHCGCPQEVQSKLFGQNLEIITPGTRVIGLSTTIAFKKDCTGCTEPLVAKLKDNFFQGFSPDVPDRYELPWNGDAIRLSQDWKAERLELMAQANKNFLEAVEQMVP